MEKPAFVIWEGVFELDYLVVIKKDADTKKFIDELRCKNGNLTITLTNNQYVESN